MNHHDDSDALQALRTDLGNARRLAGALRGRMAWVEGAGWYGWDGRRWAPWADAQAQETVGEELTRVLQDVAVLSDEEKDWKWAAESESASRIGAATRLLRGKVLVDVDDLDQHPLYLNVDNGTLNLETGALLEHTPGHWLTQVAPTRWSYTATCPRWTAFVDWMCCGDAGLATYLQEWAGYCLTGTVGLQCMAILHGSQGANGKSTFADVLMRVLGPDYAAPAPPGFFMRRHGDEHPTSLWMTRGRRLIVSSEVEDDARLDAPKLKSLTGEATQTARAMHRDFSSFTATAKYMLLTNPRPVFDGADQAVARRLHLVPCRAHMPEGDRDPGLAARLAVEEGPGILRWALDGFTRAWSAQRLNVAKVMLAELADYKADMDKLGLWLEECCERDAWGTVESSELYASYRAWVHDRGEKPLGHTSWANKMKERGYTPTRIRGTTRGWSGVALRHRAAWEPFS